jgi:hypothetical protein
MASELVTKSELKSYMNDAEVDVKADLIRLGVHAAIETYCNRVFAADESNRAEAHRVTQDYTRRLFLKKPPIISFTSLQTGESGSTLSTVDSTSYEYDTDSGIITAITTPFLASIRYVANYKGGYSSIPGEIKLVALSIMAREIEKVRKGRHGMRGRAVQATSVELFIEGLEDFERMVLDGYVLTLY